MSHHDEHPKHSGIRMVAATLDERAQVEQMLDEAERHIQRLQPGFPTQYLELTLDAFRRIVDSWSSHPPTARQTAMVREHVAEVLGMVKRNTPTLPVPRSA